MVLSHRQTTINHMKPDLESMEDMLTPPGPVAPGFASHDGNGLLYYPGAK